MKLEEPGEIKIAQRSSKETRHKYLNYNGMEEPTQCDLAEGRSEASGNTQKGLSLAHHPKAKSDFQLGLVTTRDSKSQPLEFFMNAISTLFDATPLYHHITSTPEIVVMLMLLVLADKYMKISP